ncbi:hypothetical protein GVV04_17515 [Micromonospora sp. NEAU-HG-1]|nr:hypothetical protein [Micromonospora rubida]
MRGTTNTLTIGERVAWYRYRRGLSQEVLAGLIGRGNSSPRQSAKARSAIRSRAVGTDSIRGGRPAPLSWRNSR